MGKRVDVLLLIGAALFVVEYKVGEDHYSSHAIDQVTDYSLALKNFHETSHDRYVVPILIATQGQDHPVSVVLTPHNDKLFSPIRSNGHSLRDIFHDIHAFIGEPPLEAREDHERSLLHLESRGSSKVHNRCH